MYCNMIKIREIGIKNAAIRNRFIADYSEKNVTA